MNSQLLPSTQKIIDVDTGKIKFGKKNTILRSQAIGSCIVIAAYSVKKSVGVMAHIMLPGKSPESSKNSLYAIDAIDELLHLLSKEGLDSKDIEVCLVGAANVMEKKDDTICKNNIDSILHYLDEKKIKIKAMALGGIKRRSISFDVATKTIYYTEGDDAKKLLWRAT